ncbi:MAG: flagellar basal body-associated FliL family protein [Acidobacteriota bacterium]|jgi:flagellar FliL protein|nr:flagellar basal body-associated FliL family protein [Acidobacteriota bacterium]
MAAGENEQKTDAAVAEGSAPAGGKKKSNILLVIIGILVFLLVVAVGGLIGYTRLPTLAGHASAAAHEEEEPKRPAVKGLLPLDPFLVNLADEDDVRFLKATFQLGMAGEMVGEVDKNSAEVAAIRDAIISLLTAKSSDEIMTSQGKEALREEIKTRVNAMAPANKVAEVYIVEFVVQL